MCACVMCDINIIAARDGDDKMTNGVGIDLILYDSIVIALLADGSKNRVDSGPGNDTSWKCGETKSANFSKIKKLDPTNFDSYLNFPKKRYIIKI